MFDLDTTNDPNAVKVPGIIANFIANNPRGAAKLLNDAADAHEATTGGNTQSTVPPILADAMVKPSPTENANSLAKRPAVGAALNAVQPEESANVNATSNIPSTIAKMTGVDSPPEPAAPSLATPREPIPLKDPTQSGPPSPDDDGLKGMPQLITEHVLPQEQLPSVMSNSTNMESLANIPAESPNVIKPKTGFQKFESHVPAILTALGIVGGGLEAGFGPVGAEPKGAQLFLQSINAAKNRALENRKVDVQQQNADTNENYRQDSARQFDTVPVQIQDPNDPTKTITVQVERKDLGKYVGASVTGASRERVAHINGDNKTALEEWKVMLDQGRVAFTKPVVDDQGRAVWGAYNKQGRLITTLDRSIGPAWLQPTVRSSVDVKEDGNGGYIYIPKTSTTRRVFSGAGGSAAPVSSPQQQTAQTTLAPQPSSNNAAPRTVAISGGTAQPVPTSAVRPVIGAGGTQVGSTKSKDAGYAYDPKSDATILTTRAEAGQNGYADFRKVPQPDIEKDRQNIVRVADIEQKTNQFSDAVQNGIPAGDRYVFAKILADDKFKAGLAGMEVPVDFLNKLDKAGYLDGLSTEGRRALYAYLNMKEASVGYQRVLSGSGRASDMQLKTLLDLIPNPISSPENINEGIKQFRQNLQVVKRGLPMLPGVNSGVNGAAPSQPAIGSPNASPAATTPQKYPGINFVPDSK